MNTINKKGRIIISSILVLAIITCLSMFSIFSNASRKSNTASTSGENDYSSIERDTSITVDSSGVLQISRKNREQEIPMGKENSWTIMLYLTGTNLESQYGNATSDIREILKARYDSNNVDNLNFIYKQVVAFNGILII